jgi:hypothetical protein
MMMKKKCINCLSDNIEVLNVLVDEVISYDFKNISIKSDELEHTLLLLNIKKLGGYLDFEIGGASRPNKEIFTQLLIQTLDFINERPESDFTSQSYGNFFICIHGKLENHERNNSIKYIIERYRNVGVTRREITLKLLDILRKLKVDEEILKKIPFDISKSDDGKTFQGAVFNKWFYTTEEEKLRGLAYSYMYFVAPDDSDLYIAVEVEKNEIPAEFISKNSTTIYTYDTNKSSIQRDGKLIFFAKKYIKHQMNR